MKIYSRLSAGFALLAVFAVVLMSKPLFAQNESPVQVTGTVKDSAGNPAKDCNIKLYKVEHQNDREMGGAGGGGAPGKRDAFGNPEVIEMQNKFGRPVAQAVSDKDGKFLFKAVKPGHYRYTAGNPKTTGYAGSTFDVEGGKPMTVEIQLGAPVR